MTSPQTASAISEENAAPVKRSNLTLWIMIFLFALPNLAAFYYYLNRDNIDFSGLMTNYGTIISPVRQLDILPLQTLDGSSITMSSLQGKWLMVSIGSSSCQQDCQDNLYKMRQIRKATGEFFKRVNRVFFLTDTAELASFKETLKDYPGMEVILPSDDKAAYMNMLSVFSVEGEDIQDGLYFIDPLGNYMMAYPPGAEAKKILKDLMRLLKISQIG